MHTLLGASDVGLMPPHLHGSSGQPDGKETGAAAAGEFPKVPRRVFFFFEKIILLNPAAPYKEGPVLSHSPPLQLDQELSRSGPHMAQFSTLPSQHHGFSVFTTYSPYPLPCDFKQPGLSQCCSRLVWQGREPLTQLSPMSPVAGPVGAGLGLQSPWFLSWSQGPFCPEKIHLPFVFSVSSILFGLLSS